MFCLQHIWSLTWRAFKMVTVLARKGFHNCNQLTCSISFVHAYPFMPLFFATVGPQFQASHRTAASTPGRTWDENVEEPRPTGSAIYHLWWSFEHDQHQPHPSEQPDGASGAIVVITCVPGCSDGMAIILFGSWHFSMCNYMLWQRKYRSWHFYL